VLDATLGFAQDARVAARLVARAVPSSASSRASARGAGRREPAPERTLSSAAIEVRHADSGELLRTMATGSVDVVFSIRCSAVR
jgi:hypothetical protein